MLNKKKLNAITLLLLCLCSSYSQGWKLVWSDEFDYSGLPDPNKWGYDVGNWGWGNNELENYVANRVENSRVENGTLIIEARRDWHDGIEYSSARLVTKNKGDWKYGRIEVRAKIPLGKGLWPAIWMLPTDWSYGDNYWPENGEIDIMENYALNGIKPYTSEGNVHTFSYNHTIGTNKGASINNLSNIENNYHTFAISWYEDRIDFDVDGQQYFSFANEGNWQAWPFDQRFHLILNVAVGGMLGTTPDPNIFPKRMTVDWVRVYQESIGPEPTTGLVTAYHDDIYKGHSIGLNVGEYKMNDLIELGMPDNQITSLKVTEGYRAILFEHDNYTGNTRTITSNNPNLGNWNDITSSIRIETNGITDMEGTYFLKNRWSGYFMDATGGVGGKGDGVNIQQWHGTGAENQQLKFEHIGNGSYKVFFVHSNKALDVVEISYENGANIHQWEYFGSDNQKFILFPAEDGYYKLISQHSGKLVEVTGNNSEPEANIQQWENVDQKNGQWELIDINATSNTKSIINSTPLNINQISNKDITLFIPKDGDYKVKIYGLNGKLLTQIEASSLKRGFNILKLKNNLTTSRMYLAVVEGPSIKKIRKAIIK